MAGFTFPISEIDKYKLFYCWACRSQTELKGKRIQEREDGKQQATQRFEANTSVKAIITTCWQKDMIQESFVRVRSR